MSGVSPGAEGGQRFDVVLVGGGLASGLVALALRRRRPRLRLALVEAADELGGNHTWSFHDSDVDEEGAALLQPLVVRRWERVAVAFPDHQRTLQTGYATLTSASLALRVRAALAHPGSRLLLGRRAREVTAQRVLLDDGQELHAPLVLDGRGPPPPPTFVEGQAFQKFVGQEVEIDVDVAGGVAAGLDPETALLMDATVAQSDGFRFVYLLPLAPDRLLVEDTYYSDRPELDRELLRRRLLAYLDRRGLRLRKILREEAGVLALPFGEDGSPPIGSPLRLGARGGWVHPTTGYTLPLATRVALTLASHGPGAALPALRALHRQVRGQGRFARGLNRLLFRAVAPEQRWQVLSRFYRLPRPTIERFYALATTPADRARLLLGRPPRGVSLRAAFSVLQAV